MTLEWIHETSPRWDTTKAAITDAAPKGALSVGPYPPGAPLSGEWWRVEDDGIIVAYGWMDTAWGDAEMLLAVAPEHQGRGVGSYVIEQLSDEAAVRGLNYLMNVVRPHPEGSRVFAWLQARGFVNLGDGLLRRRASGARSVSQVEGA